MTYCSRELRHVPEPMRTIRAMRRAYKLTQAELAAMLRVRVETLSRWELGKHRPSSRTMAKLTDFAERWRPSLEQRALEKRGQLRITGT